MTTTAERDIEFDVDATCDIATTQALASRHPGVRQFVIVKTTSFADSRGIVEVVGRSADGTWRCQRAAQFARLGRNGTRVLADRRSGDGTTPAGVFPLGSVTAWDGQTFQFFGNSPDPGVRGTYRDVRARGLLGRDAQHGPLPTRRQPAATAPDRMTSGSPASVGRTRTRRDRRQPRPDLG